MHRLNRSPSINKEGRILNYFIVHQKYVVHQGKIIMTFQDQAE